MQQKVKPAMQKEKGMRFLFFMSTNDIFYLDSLIGWLPVGLRSRLSH